MKIAFIFAYDPDLSKVHGDGRIRCNFEIPDAAQLLPDIQARIIAVSELVGQFTYTYLHVSCPEIGIKNHLVNEKDVQPDHAHGFYYDVEIACLYFDGTLRFSNGRSVEKKFILKIYAPITSPFPLLRKGRYARSYYSTNGYKPDTEMGNYAQRIRILSEQLLMLLNIDAPSSEWRFRGFHPSLKQKTLVKKRNQHFRKAIAEVRNRGREEEKRQAREAKLAEKRAATPQTEPLTHGAGRTIGARPGIYGGVQMRSQLEIRFAAELDERGIKWVYEGEALSESSYLVDFYLPDLGAWVEVKGRFEARDRQVLPEVAKYLKAERKQRLLVYTGAGKCCVVNPSGFRDVERKNFWGELVR